MRAQSLKSTPSLPGLGATLLIAGIFIIPLLIWGDRWPWLVALPISVMVLLTIRSELRRLRGGWIETTNIVEVNFVQPSTPEQWFIIGPDDYGGVEVFEAEMPGGIRDYTKVRDPSDERFAAIA